MAKFYAIRHVRKVGASAYVGLPMIVRHELGINVNDAVEIELDTIRKCLVVRPYKGREFRAIDSMQRNDMLPLGQNRRDEPDEPAAESTDAATAKVPA